MNRIIKSVGIVFILLLVLPMVLGAEELIQISETFTTSFFNFTYPRAYGTQSYDDVLNYGQAYNLDNIWYQLGGNCSSNGHFYDDGIYGTDNTTLINTAYGSVLNLRTNGTPSTCTFNAQTTSTIFTSYNLLLPETYKLKNSSTVSFWCSNFDKSDNYGIYLGFLNQNGTDGIMVSLNSPDGDSNCAYLPSTLSNKCCDDYADNIHTVCNNATVEQMNFTFQDMAEQCNIFGKWNITDGDNTRNVQLLLAGTSGATIGYIDDLEILMYNGSNVLPVFNVSTSLNPVCANTSYQNLYIPVNISVFDTENDTILYATTLNEIFRAVSFDLNIYTSDTVLECFGALSFRNPSLNLLSYIGFATGLCSVNYEPVNRPLPQFDTFSNSCKIIDTINSTEYYIDTKTTVLNTTASMLVYNPYCTRHKESYVNLQDTFRDFYYNTQLYIDKAVNTSINITFYDNPLFNEILLKVRLFVNETGNLNILYLNTTNETLLFNVDTTANAVGGKSYIALAINYYYDTNDFVINTSDNLNNSISSSAGVGYLVNNGAYLIKYVGVAVSNNSFNYQDSYLYGGIAGVPQFSTARLNNVTSIGFGKKQYAFYVSDVEHTNTEYTYGTLDVTVTSCDVSTQDLEIQQKGLKPLKNSLMLLCSSLDKAFTITRSDGATFNPSRYGFCFIMFVLYFVITAFISAGFCIWVYFLKPQLVFSTFFSLWSLFGIFGYLLLDYSLTFTLVISIVFAISVMITLRQIFLTGDTVGN